MIPVMSLAVACVSMCMAAAEESREKIDPRPQHERMLKGDDAKRAAELDKKASDLEAAGKRDQARKVAEELLRLREKLQGADHFEAIETKVWIDDLRQPRTAEQVKRLEEADKLNEQRAALEEQGKFAKAAALAVKEVALRREVLGPHHPYTAASLNNLAFLYQSQSKYAQAEPLYKDALKIRRESFGERHPATAAVLSNLASLYQAEGKHALAEPLFRDSLKITREALGEWHLDTAKSLNDLAALCEARGRYAEAEPLLKGALQVYRKALGEEHRDTATGLNDLASLYQSQGRYAEAEPLYRDALKAYRRALGEKHPETATALNNLASLYSSQGKYAEAEPLYRDALKIRREALGEKHHLTAQSLVALAELYRSQARYADAEPLHRDALKIRREVLGEGHPDTAAGLNNLAMLYSSQGKYADAEPLYKAALKIRREALGERHPDTAESLNNLAELYMSRGEYTQAAALLAQCRRSFEASRLLRGKALERSLEAAGGNPYPLLAAASARLAKPSDAFAAAELNLARGLLDEQSSRRGAALTAAEQERQSQVAGRLAAIESRVAALAGLAKLKPAERRELDRLAAERRGLEDTLADLAATVSRREVAEPKDVQASLAADAALITWVDIRTSRGKSDEHWACVLRRADEPAWVRLPGSGDGGRWTPDEIDLSDKLGTSLSGGQTAGEVNKLSAALHAQRLAPLEKHLQGVKTLHVAAVDDMAGVPIETLTDRYTISYVPSGTFLARQKDQPKSSGSGLLAVGDPIFGTRLRPKADLLVSRGSTLTDLPGTRTEVGGIAKLFGGGVTVLLDSDASEQKLEELREKGDLSKYRYLHFATHGEANNAKAFESVIYLAQDKLPQGVLPETGRPVINGELSAREVLEHWKLDAALVTLSACETALGQQAGGDGMLGFAQAFLAAGARSVCLSLWKVDDTATALLMMRFYGNLLGKRDGLQKPMPKAEALREAKEWLRGLSLEEAKKLTADMAKGVTRGERGGNAKMEVVVPKDAKADAPEKEPKPYAHPRYWAAFILIGDPN